MEARRLTTDQCKECVVPWWDPWHRHREVVCVEAHELTAVPFQDFLEILAQVGAAHDAEFDDEILASNQLLPGRGADELNAAVLLKNCCI